MLYIFNSHSPLSSRTTDVLKPEETADPKKHLKEKDPILSQKLQKSPLSLRREREDRPS
jgi:hypothetical protein